MERKRKNTPMARKRRKTLARKRMKASDLKEHMISIITEVCEEFDLECNFNERAFRKIRKKFGYHVELTAKGEKGEEILREAVKKRALTSKSKLQEAFEKLESKIEIQGGFADVIQLKVII